MGVGSPSWRLRASPNTLEVGADSVFALQRQVLQSVIMRRKQSLLKLALLQEKHRTIRELIQFETDQEKLRMYKAELESIASELRDLHHRIQDLLSYKDAA
jgi:protein subunit release factor A